MLSAAVAQNTPIISAVLSDGDGWGASKKKMKIMSVLKNLPKKEKLVFCVIFSEDLKFAGTILFTETYSCPKPKVNFSVSKMFWEKC